jgi:hypothetical protein
VCDCILRDSMSYLDHINGKYHNRALGMNMRVERSTADQARDLHCLHSNALGCIADEASERVSMRHASVLDAQVRERFDALKQKKYESEQVDTVMDGAALAPCDCLLHHTWHHRLRCFGCINVADPAYVPPPGFDRRVLEAQEEEERQREERKAAKKRRKVWAGTLCDSSSSL